MPEIDKEKVKKHFSRQAESYDKYASLQKEMGEMLIERIKEEVHAPKNILDIGTGTGELAIKLSSLFPQVEIAAIDIAEGMIKVAQSKLRGSNIRFEAADGERLSYPAEALDLVVSNAALQWMDLNSAFSEFARVLKPLGKLFFTTFGPATLKELNNLNLSRHTFPSKEEHLKILSQNFRKAQITSQKKVKNYLSLKELLFFIKETGAQGAFAKTGRGLSPKAKFKGLNLPVSATYEILLGSCAK